MTHRQQFLEQSDAWSPALCCLLFGVSVHSLHRGQLQGSKGEAHVEVGARPGTSSLPVAAVVKAAAARGPGQGRQPAAVATSSTEDLVHPSLSDLRQSLLEDLFPLHQHPCRQGIDPECYALYAILQHQ